MIEIMCLILVGVMVKDHRARMKELGKQARNYGTENA